MTGNLWSATGRQTVCGIHLRDIFFPDGEAYTLCKPNYTISEWYAEEIKPEDLFCTVRIPLRHVGMGQMMALDPVEIEALAAKVIIRIWNQRTM